MKRTLSLLSVLAFVLAFSGSAFAQAASSDVNVSANVVGSLSASTDAAMQFGKISDEFSGNQPSITPEASADGGSFSNTGSSAQQGEVSISGSGSQGIIISFNNPSTLASTTNSGTPISFTADYIGNDGSGGANDDLNESGTNSVTLNNGSYTVYLGGTLGMNGNTTLNPASDYNGTITVNIDFQ